MHGTFVEAQGAFGGEIDFLSKVLGRMDYRPFYDFILIEPSEKDEAKFRGVACDGRRLHLVDPLACPDNIGIEAGWWRLLRSEPGASPATGTAWIAKVVDCDLSNFPIVPKYRNVIPAGKPEFETDYCFAAAPMGWKEDLGLTIGEAFRFLGSFPEPTGINPAFLADLGNNVWKVSWYGQMKAVVFDSCHLKAVIMPINLTGGIQV